MVWMWDNSNRDYGDERQWRDGGKRDKEEGRWKEGVEIAKEWRNERGKMEWRVKVWYI